MEIEIVEFLWVPTNEIVADGLTKPLTSKKHAVFLRQIGLTKV